MADLGLDRDDDTVDASPLVAVLGLSADNAKTLEDVYDVVDPAALRPQLSSAPVQEKKLAILAAIEAKEPLAQLAEALLLAVVAHVVLPGGGGSGALALRECEL